MIAFLVMISAFEYPADSLICPIQSNASEGSWFRQNFYLNGIGNHPIRFAGRKKLAFRLEQVRSGHNFLIENIFVKIEVKRPFIIHK